MQREILFKAKRKTSRKQYQTWIYGYLFKDVNGICQILFNEKNGDIRFEEVIPETICEYTSLKDKKGVKMFENDLVKVKNYHYYKDKEYLIGKIVYKDGMFQIHCEDGVNASIFMFQVWSDSIEVIKNIFDEEVK